MQHRTCHLLVVGTSLVALGKVLAVRVLVEFNATRLSQGSYTAMNLT